MSDDIKRKRGNFAQAQLDQQEKITAEYEKIRAIADKKAEPRTPSKPLLAAYAAVSLAIADKDQTT